MQETNESLGSYLKRTREEKNVSIEQVAYATRISLKMLRALEEDDHTALPAPTFVRGYLQAYSKYVRIDTQDLLLRYQHHLATAPDAKRSAIRSHYLYVRERYQEKRRLVLVIVLFATMLSVAGTYFFLKSQREKHKRLARTAEQIQRSEESKSPASTPSTVSTAEIAAATASGKEKDKEKETAKTPVLTTPTSPEKEILTEKDKEKPAEKPTVKAPEKPPVAPPVPVAASPVVPPVAPASLPPVEKTVSKEETAPAPKEGAEVIAKNFHLLLKASEDVWFRYQTDEDEIKDLTLRTGKQMLLRANKVIKIFSGNLGALKAKLNGKEMPTLATGNRSKSVILPENEAGNYTLPLFPQFQTKPVATRVNAETNPGGSGESPTTPPSDNAPTPSPAH